MPIDNSETESTKGKQVSFPDGRCVFLSNANGKNRIEFRSKEGIITRLQLSEDAFQALRALSDAPVAKHFVVEEVWRQNQIGHRWQVVPEVEA